MRTARDAGVLALLLALAPGYCTARACRSDDGRSRSCRSRHSRDRNDARTRGATAATPNTPEPLPPQDPDLLCDRACLQPSRTAI